MTTSPGMAPGVRRGNCDAAARLSHPVAHTVRFSPARAPPQSGGTRGPMARTTPPEFSPSPQLPGAGATVHELFAGGGELGALMARFDWSATSLGPVEQWPQALVT